MSILKKISKMGLWIINKKLLIAPEPVWESYNFEVWFSTNLLLDESCLYMHGCIADSTPQNISLSPLNGAHLYVWRFTVAHTHI